MEEIDFLSQSIQALTNLFSYFENLENDNIAKMNILTKSDELIFWLTYYKEDLEEDDEQN